LRQTQRWLASVILAPERLDDPGFASEIASVVAIDDPARAVTRLRAYTGGYPARIGDALEQDYPALVHVVGHRAFHLLVERYLPHVAAGIYNLNDVGGRFADVVARDDIAVEYPFAPDLVRLETAVRAAFHARDGAPLDAATLADWTLEDWDAAVLRFQPSVFLVRSQWPVRDIWDARETPIEEIDIAMEGTAQSVLVHRTGLQVTCEAIGDDEAHALELLLAGRRLGDVAEEIAECGGDPDAVGGWFSRWHGRGLIVACARA